MILEINISNHLKINNINHDLIASWLDKCATLHNKKISVLEIHILTDEELLDINKQIFNRDYLTDVISIAYPGPNDISGSIFISYERVKENAEKYSVSADEELNRVIIHGLLHILGFEDSTTEEKENMRNWEDKCLKLLV